MSANRSARHLCLLGVLVALGSLVAGAPAAAQADERKIEIWLESPPSLAPAIDLRLSQGGSDITDADCGPITTPVGSANPQRQCADLGDGTFAVSVTGAPADALVTWECRDIVAASTEHTAIPLGGGFTEWRCVATVSPPGVVIDGTYSVGDDGAPLDDLALVIQDDTGTPIPPCELDERSTIPRQWCGPLANGTYEAIPQDIPEGLRAATSCSDLAAVFDQRANPFTVDDAIPRWFCEQPTPFEPLAFGVRWAGAGGRDPSWFVATTPTVTNTDGDDVSASCTESQRSDEDGYKFIDYVCVGVPAGSYTVTFSGIPSDFDVSTDCEPVEVPEQPGLESAWCSVTVNSEPLDVPVDDPVDPPDEPDPPALPDTGTGTGSGMLLMWGFVLLVSGTTLVRASRRRSLD